MNLRLEVSEGIRPFIVGAVGEVAIALVTLVLVLANRVFRL